MSLRQRGAESTASSSESSWSVGFSSSADMATVDVRDRTSEFHQACRAAKSKRTAPSARDRDRLPLPSPLALPRRLRRQRCVCRHKRRLVLSTRSCSAARSPADPGPEQVGVHVGRRGDRQGDPVHV